MDYLDNVWRSFRITWRHKYLWLIALFSGESGSSGSFNFNVPSNRTGAGSVYNTTQIQDQVTSFLTNYAGLIIALVVLLLVLVVVFFLLGAVCEGATIRSSAEHDAERQWGLGLAWRAGVHTMWPIVRFRLLIFALALPIILVVLALITASIIAFSGNNSGLGVGLVLVGVVLVLPLIVYAIYLSFLDRLGSRALVLEQLGARAAIVRAHRLLVKRLGRTLLVWLFSIVVALIVGIATACVFSIIFIPLALIGVAIVAAANNFSAVVLVIIIGALLVLPISLVLGGFLAAQSSTYWTLAFRRLEIDRPPVTYGYAAAPPPPAPA